MYLYYRNTKCYLRLKHEKKIFKNLPIFFIFYCYRFEESPESQKSGLISTKGDKYQITKNRTNNKLIVADRVREWGQTLVGPTCGRHPLSEGGLTRRDGGGSRTEGELNLSDMSLRTSERGEIIFAVDWSSITDYCSIVKLLFQDRREKRERRLCSVHRCHIR